MSAQCEMYGDVIESLQRLVQDASFDADWNEADHPRGQPDNAGQFASKGEGASAGAKPADSKQSDKNGGVPGLTSVLSTLKGLFRGQASNETGRARDDGSDIKHPIARHLVSDGGYSREYASGLAALFDELDASPYGQMAKKGYDGSMLIEDLKSFAKEKNIALSRTDDFALAHGQADVLSDDMYAPKIFELMAEGVKLEDLADGRIPESVPDYHIGNSKVTTHSGLKDAARKYLSNPQALKRDKDAYDLKKASMMVYLLNSKNPLVDVDSKTMVLGRTETSEVVPKGSKVGDVFSYDADPNSSFTYDYFKVVDGSANSGDERDQSGMVKKVAVGYVVPLCKINSIDTFPSTTGGNPYLDEFADLMDDCGLDSKEYEANANTRGLKAVVLGDGRELENKGTRLKDLVPFIREHARQ